MDDQRMREFASRMVRKNSRIANSPEGQEFLRLLESGDDEAGIAMANKVLTGNGLTRNQGLQKAMEFFGMTD